MADGLEQVKIQWHPGFYGAAELELIGNKGDLEFLREYNQSKEPIRMDLLVIKKLSDVPIQNEIGHIFKKYNVVEYKSPDSGLSVDGFYKTVGYACLYKGLGETENGIPAGWAKIPQEPENPFQEGQGRGYQGFHRRDLRIGGSRGQA